MKTSTPVTDDWPRRIQHRLREFAAARGWERFHDPRSLLLALIGEVGELAELHQWVLDSPPDPSRVADEVADVAIYLLRFADVAGIDLADAVADKIERNETRFPTIG